jgi:hypothetical protein
VTFSRTSARNARRRMVARRVHSSLALTAVVVPKEVPTAEIESIRTIDAVEVSPLAIEIAAIEVTTADIVYALAAPLHRGFKRAFAIADFHSA